MIAAPICVCPNPGSWWSRLARARKKLTWFLDEVSINIHHGDDQDILEGRVGVVRRDILRLVSLLIPCVLLLLRQGIEELFDDFLALAWIVAGHALIDQRRILVRPQGGC